MARGSRLREAADGIDVVRLHDVPVCPPLQDLARRMSTLRILMSSILLAWTSASGSAAAGLWSPSTAELAGCYRWESERGWSSLRLSPDGRYVAYTTVGLGLLAKASGGWGLEEGQLGLSPSTEVRNWFRQADEPIVVGRDVRGAITLTSALGEFSRVPNDLTCGP